MQGLHPQPPCWILKVASPVAMVQADGHNAAMVDRLLRRAGLRGGAAERGGGGR